MREPSPEQRSLLEERGRARADGDFARADAIRDQLHAQGWDVRDTAAGAELLSRLETVEIHDRYAGVAARFGAPDALEFSVCVAMQGWPEDVVRLRQALSSDQHDTEMVIVDVRRKGVTPGQLGARGGPEVRVLRVEEEIGHAQAWTVAARQARGRVLVFAEPSLEFGPQVLEGLAQALAEPGVGLVGPFGLASADQREFAPAAGPEVKALEYLLAIRRADMARVGEFDPYFSFYRNLDIDFSYQVAHAGLAVRRVDCPGIQRHAHRLWESTPAEERERLSRKNFRRFLNRRVRF